MKYDDDELAEAALLLAHVEPAGQMPKALENVILEQATHTVAEVRLSTTKVGAVAVDEPDAPVAPVRRLSFARRWGGWLAAAACFSIVVYQWRLHALSATQAARPVSSPDAIAIRSPAGLVLARVTPREAIVTIEVLPENVPGERYELWLSPAGPERAVAVGAFVCKEECRSRAFTLRETRPQAAVHGDVDWRRQMAVISARRALQALGLEQR